MKTARIFNILTYSLSLLIISLTLTGCHTPKDVAYFQDISDETIMIPSSGEIKIMPNDKLTILIKTMDPTLSALFNLAVPRLKESEERQLLLAKGPVIWKRTL